MNVSHAWAMMATTPVTQTPPLFHSSRISPFQMWKTMKGNVWMSARTNMAQAIQLCQMFIFSWEIPVIAVMGFAFAPRMLQMLALKNF